MGSNRVIDCVNGRGGRAPDQKKSMRRPSLVHHGRMPFLRRMFGGYSDRDPPPSPHNYWPTCMGTQTYFRLPNTPQLAIYGNKYRAWFTGMAPIDKPRIIVAVMIDEPSAGQYYGGAVAAPVFSEVVQQTLRMMGVQPDMAVKPQIVAKEVEESF